MCNITIETATFPLSWYNTLTNFMALYFSNQKKKYPQKDKLTKLTQEEIEDLNRGISNIKIKIQSYYKIGGILTKVISFSWK